MAKRYPVNGKPHAENPHVRFDEGDAAQACTAETSLRRVHCRRRPEGRTSMCATPRRGSLLCKKLKNIFLLATLAGTTSLFGQWRDLFAPDYSDGDFDPAIWYTDGEGNLTARKDVAFWTKDDYSRFELECEYNLEPAANSGIVIYCSNTKKWIPNSVEIQLIDNDAPKWKNLNPRQANLAFFGHQAPSSNPVKPAGEWNRINLVADGPRLKITLNGIVVNECDLSLWTDAKKLPDGSAIPSWLSRPWSELEQSGKIGFQGRHGGAGVKFRNIRIRPLPSKCKLKRIMSFNIRMGCGHDAPFKLEKGSLGFLPRCAEVIRRFDPDVCVLQEVDCRSARAGEMDQTAELAKLVGMEGSWVEKIKNYGISTLYKERPFKVSKVLLKGSLHTRALMISEYADYVIANTHFPLSKQLRIEAVATIRAALKAYTDKKPVFLMGDMNASPASETMTALKEDFVLLTDPAIFTFPAKAPNRTIDYIMIDKAHAKSYSCVKSLVFAAPEATDHAALVVDVEPR